MHTSKSLLMVIRRSPASAYLEAPLPVIEARLNACVNCQHRKQLKCSLSNNEDIAMVIGSVESRCPIASQSPTTPIEQKREKLKVSWMIGDLSKGGTTTFLDYVSRATKNDVTHTGVLVHSDTDPFQDIISSIKTLMPVYLEAASDIEPDKVFNKSDVVNIIARHPKWSPITTKERLSWHNATPVVHAHGGGEWTRECLQHAIDLGVKHIATISYECEKLVRQWFPQINIISGRAVISSDNLITDASVIRCRKELAGSTSLSDHLYDPWFGYIGRFAPEKRLDLMLSCILRLRELALSGQVQHPVLADALSRARLVIWGGGIFEKEIIPKLEIVASKAGFCALSDVCSILPWRTGIASIFNAVDSMVCTSDSEGLPTYTLEAMIAGCPSASTPVGEMPYLQNRRGALCALPLYPDEEGVIATAERLADWYCNHHKVRNDRVAPAQRTASDAVNSLAVLQKFNPQVAGKVWLDMWNQITG